jgi:hypothetical protein
MTLLITVNRKHLCNVTCMNVLSKVVISIVIVSNKEPQKFLAIIEEMSVKVLKLF